MLCVCVGDVMYVVFSICILLLCVIKLMFSIFPHISLLYR